jgi:uncharacterized protein (DUF2249 family)/hemerythrin-like domain-containing protein
MADTVTAVIAVTSDTTTVGEAIHNHHQEILKTLTGHVEAIVSDDKGADPGALVTFLKGDLLPHARGEEAYLYPAVDPLVKAHGKATATMEVDHEFISGYINSIDQTVAALRSASAAEESALKATLQRLCLQLEAVLALHLEKEERVYVPIFTRYLPEEEQRRVLDGMHEAYGDEPADAEVEADTGTVKAPDQVLDVRTIAPRQRHELIFDTFGALAPGGAFVLVNDHDPKPLYYQFKAELDGLFTWDYLEQGPEVWRVRIGRV